MRVEPGQPTFHLTPVEPATRSRQLPPLGDVERADVVVDIGVPPSPPPEALDKVREAARIAEQLAADNRELHFRKDARSGRVIVEVRDLRGSVIRTIPPSAALEAMTPGIWR